MFSDMLVSYQFCIFHIFPQGSGRFHQKLRNTISHEKRWSLWAVGSYCCRRRRKKRRPRHCKKRQETLQRLVFSQVASCCFKSLAGNSAFGQGATRRQPLVVIIFPVRRPWQRYGKRDERLARFSEDTKAGMPDFVSNWEIYTILAISLSLFHSFRLKRVHPCCQMHWIKILAIVKWKNIDKLITQGMKKGFQNLPVDAFGQRYHRYS